MKQNVSIKDHYFDKVNLVTITKGNQSYDEYKCTKCGLFGKRLGLTDMIEVNKKVPACKAQEAKEVPKKVRVLFDGGGLGVIAGDVYEVVECPKEYADRFLYDVWVVSTKRNEPVRLLENEYEII